MASELGALTGVFNASVNLGKLYRLENRPKSRKCLVNLGWGSDSMDGAMPCKKETKGPGGSRETGAKHDASTEVPKTKYACKVEGHESTSQRVEPSLPKNHEEHIAGRGYNTMSHDNMVHNFFPWDAKAEVDKEWKKLETTPEWQLGKAKRKK